MSDATPQALSMAFFTASFTFAFRLLRIALGLLHDALGAQLGVAGDGTDSLFGFADGLVAAPLILSDALVMASLPGLDLGLAGALAGFSEGSDERCPIHDRRIAGGKDSHDASSTSSQPRFGFLRLFRLFGLPEGVRSCGFLDAITFPSPLQ